MIKGKHLLKNYSCCANVAAVCMCSFASTWNSLQKPRFSYGIKKKSKVFHIVIIILSSLVKFLFSFLFQSVGEYPNCLLVIVANPSYFAFSTLLI